MCSWTRGTSITSNRYRWVCTWYRWPVDRDESPIVTQYLPAAYGNAVMRNRTRFLPSNRSIAMPWPEHAPQ